MMAQLEGPAIMHACPQQDCCGFPARFKRTQSLLRNNTCAMTSEKRLLWKAHERARIHFAIPNLLLSQYECRLTEWYVFASAITKTTVCVGFTCPHSSVFV